MGDHAHRGTTAESVADAHPFARPSRRSMLKGSLVAIAGAIGWGAGAASQGGGTTSASAGSLSLEGVRMRAGGGEPGGLAAHGELTGRGGASLGTFSSTRLAMPRTAGSTATGAELQTFSLAGGSIFGMGTPAADDETAAFAIIGGTGKYAGAVGTYTAAQRPIERGGDGTASFDFTFTNHATN